MSMPRAATSVATRNWIPPARIFAITRSRSVCDRSDEIASAS